MSFFGLSDGTIANAATFDMGGGDIQPIPEKTELLAVIDEAKWDSYEGQRYISLRWAVMQPQAFANRKVFQKLKIEESDARKRDKAKRMMFAIDVNAGGKIAQSGREPNDQDLIIGLCNKPMMIKVGLWVSEDKSKSGNWIMSVAPRNGSPAQPVQQSAAILPTPAPDDDIPF